MESGACQKIFIETAFVLEKMKSTVVFAEDRIKKSLRDLKNSKTEDQKLYKWILRAMEDLEDNAFCGIQLSKRLIPRMYTQKFGIDNLWKYDLPRGWRLIYSVSNDRVSVVSIVLEWMDHKNYERRFGY